MHDSLVESASFLSVQFLPLPPLSFHVCDQVKSRICHLNFLSSYSYNTTLQKKIVEALFFILDKSNTWSWCVVPEDTWLDKIKYHLNPWYTINKNSIICSVISFYYQINLLRGSDGHLKKSWGFQLSICDPGLSPGLRI